MINRKQIVLLADKLDRMGLSAEAEAVDKVIVKNSFAQETGADMLSALGSMVESLESMLSLLEGDNKEEQADGSVTISLTKTEGDQLKKLSQEIRDFALAAEGLSALVGQDLDI